jgi:hypothetical protein
MTSDGQRPEGPSSPGGFARGLGTGRRADRQSHGDPGLARDLSRSGILFVDDIVGLRRVLPITCDLRILIVEQEKNITSVDVDVTGQFPDSLCHVISQKRLFYLSKTRANSVSSISLFKYLDHFG